MHNLKDIRKNKDFFKKKFSERNTEINLDDILHLDKENRNLILKKESLEQEKKNISKQKDSKNFKKSKEISSEIKDISESQNKIQKNLNEKLSFLPNIALDDVPVGKNESSNKLIKQHGTIKEFGFSLKSHHDLGKKDKMIDLDTSVKLSGARFSILRDKYALLERALINFMLDTHTQKFGYTEISPPLIVNEDVMYGTGQLPKFEEDQFEIKLENQNIKKYLIPTAEVVLTNLVRESILSKKELPLRFVASTPCFRKEAGSYGKDTSGLMRQHQFFKVELVSIVEHEKCTNELDRMLSCAEEILKILNIPYRIVLLSTGDMGFSAEKTFDIEAWIPFEKKFREISSCSSCGTFQSRRMRARYKDDKDTKYLGTLNGSGLAVGRLMISFLENNQNKDGTIDIPEVLKKYMGNLDKI